MVRRGTQFVQIHESELKTKNESEIENACAFM